MSILEHRRHDERILGREMHSRAVKPLSSASSLPVIRFSLGGLLVAVTIVALLFPSLLASWNSEASEFAFSLGGLNLCALFFALVCGVMGASHWKAFGHGLLFYAWGFACLLAAETWHLSMWQRWLLASVAVVYSVWIWFGRREKYYYPRPADPYEAPR
jgi:hypothetical protein